MNASEQSYVVGFLFTDDFSQVLLIKKNRPSHLAGLLNGVGGKVEPGETALQAMERECWEESGLRGVNWTYVSRVQNGSATIHVFRGTLPNEMFFEYETKTDEIVRAFPVDYILKRRENTSPLALWNMMLCLSFDRHNCRYTSLSIHY